MCRYRICCLPGLLLLAACSPSKILNDAAKNITLNTPEPVKVDMKITMDIYRHDAPEDGSTKEEAAAKETEGEDAARKRKFNRQEEIQTLKNSRLIAETHRGLLFLREKPAGEWGDQVEKSVEAENVDRNLLMRLDAERARRPLSEVMQERYDANVKSAHTGEWLEATDPEKPGSFILIQKQ